MKIIPKIRNNLRYTKGIHILVKASPYIPVNRVIYQYW